jgi:hypothetical protein
VSGTDSNAQPPAGQQSNRDRRYVPKKTARASFPVLTSAEPGSVLRGTDLDLTDPAAGGGRGFWYEWEDETQQLHQEILDVAANGGGGGSGVAAVVYHQTTPSSLWTINHNMGLYPSVTLLDPSNQQMMAEVQFPSDQQVVVVHSAPYAGTAYLRP